MMRPVGGTYSLILAVVGHSHAVQHLTLNPSSLLSNPSSTLSAPPTKHPTRKNTLQPATIKEPAEHMQQHTPNTKQITKHATIYIDMYLSPFPLFLPDNYSPPKM